MVSIYILELTNNKYYIGKTNNSKFRLESHFNNEGSEWTKKYKPIKLIQLINNCDNYDEDKYTLQYMEKYGINNVRGGSFCKIKLNLENKKTIRHMLNGSTNKCYKCRNNDHYINNCPKINKDFNKSINKGFDFSDDSSDDVENVKSPFKKKTIFSKKNVSKCFRCGRNGHFSSNCYASKHIKGYYID